MQIIIDISEDYYKDIQSRDWKNPIWADEVTRAIHEGTVLPEHHGRLIDADKFEELFEKECVGDCGACMPKRKTDGRGRWYDTCSLIDNAPTILESTEVDHE